MVNGEIQCARCGWHNEATAIMCGGCGQPLRASAPSYPPPATAQWAQAPATTPGVPAARRASGASNAPTWPAPGGWVPPANAAPAARAAARPRRSGCLSGCLWTLAITVTLFALLVAGTWGLVVRPAVHAQADSALASGIGALIASVPAIPEQALQFTGPTFTVSEASTNDLLRQAAPAVNGMQTLTARYTPGVARVHYAARGWAGDITMRPLVRGGQIAVEDVHVTGILGWIESGPELQVTLNRQLAALTGKTPHGFASLSVATGQMMVTLKTA
ncbi:MAG TPA: hypothetical protein VGR57_19680 [Ktedonobacterales bacterium]|nr:hypothetical protein [Ktedonobacterales bacterium]